MKKQTRASRRTSLWWFRIASRLKEGKADQIKTGRREIEEVQQGPGEGQPKTTLQGKANPSQAFSLGGRRLLACCSRHQTPEGTTTERCAVETGSCVRLGRYQVCR